MTNEKASVIIGNIPVYGDECYSIAEYQEAQTVAVQALLQKPKTGNWIKHNESMTLLTGATITGGVICSECGYKTHNKAHVIVGCP